MLQLIRTAVDTDLSSVFIPQMLKFRDEYPDTGIILVVPDSLSHTSERLMAKTFGGTGINGIETMTFHQMIRRFLPECQARLTDTGKRMLFFRAVKALDIKNGIFAASLKKQGFADCVCDLISEFKRYGVSPDTLRLTSKKTDNSILSDKLSTLSDIYEKYNCMFTEEGFSDNDDDLIKVAEAVSANKYFNDKAIWFAGFDDLLPTQTALVGAVLKTCGSVTVFLPQSFEDADENSLFSQSEHSANKLIEICRKHSIMFSYETILSHREKTPELEFLIENYETTKAVCKDTPSYIHITENSGIYEETDCVASAICDYTLEYGFHYSDIGVAVSDPDAYLPFAEAIFNEYNIPYFCDMPVSVSEHPASMIITAVSDMVRENRSTASVLRYMRTGLVSVPGNECNITEDDIDEIENYALKRGIRGDMWNTEKFWTTEENGIFDAVIGEHGKAPVQKALGSEMWEKVRAVTVPIKKLCKAVNKPAAAQEFCNALFEFFEDIGLYETIKKKTEQFLTSNPNEALRYEQIWNLITELCEQSVRVLSSELLVFDEFYYYIKNGLVKSKMDIIPAGIDRVTLASVSDTMPNNIKILFVLGANSGKLPSVSASEGLLSDSDRAFISSTGTELAPYGMAKNLHEEFKLFKLIASSSMHIHISYALSDTTGNSMLPCMLVSDIQKLFPNIQIFRPDSEKRIVISSPEVTLKKLLVYKDRENPLWQKLYSWFEKQPERWPEKLSLIEKSEHFSNYTPSLESENALKLYQNYTKYSISRLESFYVCPFRYFLENGIKAKEREERRIKKSDLGDLLHWAVQKYCLTVDAGGSPEQKHENWLSLTEEKSRKIIDDIIGSAKEKLALQESHGKKTAVILSKVRELLLRTVPVINMSFKNSKYTAYGYEWSFDDLTFSDGETSVSMRGIIDRLDIYENADDNAAHIRVIDYKSGSAAFSLSSIYNKLDLQLGVYAIAAEQAYKKGNIPNQKDFEPEVNGIFYDKLTDKFEKSVINTIMDEENAGSSVLDGMTFTKPSVIKGKEVFEAKSFKDIDSSLQHTSKSSYIKLCLNKSGTALDKRYSSIESSQNMKVMQDWIKKAVIDADKQIRSGVIDIMPYKKGKNETGCNKYCPYEDICTFDREKNECYRTIDNSRSDIFEKMKKTIEEKKNGTQMDR